MVLLKIDVHESFPFFFTHYYQKYLFMLTCFEPLFLFFILQFLSLALFISLLRCFRVMDGEGLGGPALIKLSCSRGVRCGVTYQIYVLLF